MKLSFIAIPSLIAFANAAEIEDNIDENPVSIHEVMRETGKSLCASFEINENGGGIVSGGACTMGIVHDPLGLVFYSQAESSYGRPIDLEGKTFDLFMCDSEYVEAIGEYHDAWCEEVREEELGEEEVTKEGEVAKGCKLSSLLAALQQRIFSLFA